MELIKFENKILFVYYFSEYYPNDWVSKNLKEKREVTFKNTFHFLRKDKFNLKDNKDIVEDYDYFKEEGIPPPLAFTLGVLDGDYYKINKRMLQTNNSVYFFKEIEPFTDHFIAEIKISIFKQIDRLVNEDIYIGGNIENAITIEDFNKLIQNFPTTYEKKIYAEARVASIIKNYFETTKDAETTFQNYLNKKSSKIGRKLNKLFKENELLKYSTILEKLKGMLNSENSYSEDQWQNEILEIILLLYPKYILSFKSVHVKIENKKRRFLDFMLVDCNGNIDVIEIKKPFENVIMTNSLYRNNHIPHKDLIGTVMQLEKYIYHLNRWGEKGEKHLSEKYQNELPKELKIKITNPKGFIIMGRENNLTIEQLSDFEVVKRKYKNIIDIISYDDLLERLRMTIEQIKKM